MSRVCDNCGKRPHVGRTLARRGLAKYVGGVGIKTTGITKRVFAPNLQRVRAQDKDGRVNRLKVCTKCMRSGMVRKPVKRDIPESVRDEMAVKERYFGAEARRKRAAERAARRKARKAGMTKKAAAKQQG